MAERSQILQCIQDPILALKRLDEISCRTSLESQIGIKTSVEHILEEVKQFGDKAVIQFTQKFDGFTPEPIAIGSEKITDAWEQTPQSLKKALKVAKERIESFHKHQFPKDFIVEGMFGETLGRKWHPVEKAGIYVPGGRASYPSTVLMNAIPAIVAGVEKIFMVSPANNKGEINKTVLAAAHVAGIKNIFRIGGAQAIGALAYGTESIPRVDVISGPGNIYVTLAKKSVYGQVGIDSLAGPSEVLIIADESADKEQVASDLLAQAEHDPLASSILLTTNSSLVEPLKLEINNQLKSHPRAEICRQSLSNWGLIVVCKDLESCAELSNKFAPEHLELLIEKPSELTPKIKNAGAIFIGCWSPEATGDYLAGPNHTLPTSGTSRFSSALGVETFMKSTSLINFSKKALENTSKDIIELAHSEGLYSHANSIKVRLPKTSSID